MVVKDGCGGGNLWTDIPAANTPARSRNLRRVIKIQASLQANINEQGKGMKPFALQK
jgi:hypothetical protein